MPRNAYGLSLTHPSTHPDSSTAWSRSISCTRKSGRFRHLDRLSKQPLNRLRKYRAISKKLIQLIAPPDVSENGPGKALAYLLTNRRQAGKQSINQAKKCLVMWEWLNSVSLSVHARSCSRVHGLPLTRLRGRGVGKKSTGFVTRLNACPCGFLEFTADYHYLTDCFPPCDEFGLEIRDIIGKFMTSVASFRPTYCSWKKASR